MLGSLPGHGSLLHGLKSLSHCKDRITILVQVTDTKAISPHSSGFLSTVNGKMEGLWIAWQWGRCEFM